MPVQHFDYDAFLSHASEDIVWCEKLAELLRNNGVRVWFDKWEIMPGDHLLRRLDEGMLKSRKMIAIWSSNFFRNDKVYTQVESYSQLHQDPLAKERRYIPLLFEDCEILPTLRNFVYIDFRGVDLNQPQPFQDKMDKLIQAIRS